MTDNTPPAVMGAEAFMATAKPSTASHSGNDAVAVRIAAELRDIVRDAAMNAPRQVQRHLGPSELGVECDRQVVHKLTGQPDTNHVVDPWPSIVGTAIHAWLDTTFTNAQPPGRWLPERKVAPTDEHPGTADLYDARNFRVIDHKGLAIDTPVPTPDGWSLVGDLQVGDMVFGSDGSPCTVTNTYPYQERVCYRVRFTDGTELVVDDVQEFVWTLSDSGREVTASAAESVGMVWSSRKRAQRNLRLYNSDALVLPERQLPVEPYVLGCWLGDGSIHGGVITQPHDVELFEHIEQQGYVVGPPIGARGVSRTVYGLASDLRRAGILHRDTNWPHSHGRLTGTKRIPTGYLRASHAQRLALLQGLMDTDGTWNRARKQAVFITTDAALARQVQELVATLGWNAHINSQRASGFGVDTTVYHVAYSPFGANPFRLTRKARQVRLEGSRRARYRLVEYIEPVPTVTTRCIDVDSPDHLYLAGRDFLPVHNCLGSSTHDKLRTQGPPRHYFVQLLLYALGYIRAGFRVDSIAIAAWPRTGSSLAGLYVWHHVITADDWRLVEEVLADTKRRKDYAALVDGGHITMNQVPRTPSSACYHCPAYRPEAGRDGGPGCPGTVTSTGPKPPTMAGQAVPGRVPDAPLPNCDLFHLDTLQAIRAKVVLHPATGPHPGPHPGARPQGPKGQEGGSP